jgi:hypothetical protein
MPPFLAGGGSGEDFRAGIERAIALGWRRGRQRRIAGYARHLARVFAPSFRDETTSPLTSFG